MCRPKGKDGHCREGERQGEKDKRCGREVT
jgi:hypothetical protein